MAFLIFLFAGDDIMETREVQEMGPRVKISVCSNKSIGALILDHRNFGKLPCSTNSYSRIHLWVWTKLDLQNETQSLNGNIHGVESESEGQIVYHYFAGV